MPGLNDPNDASFTDPAQDGGWKWNADTQQWEPTDPVVNAIWGIPRALGLQSTPIHADAAGSSLNAGQSEEDRQRMGGYLSQLQGQATTGGGAWEQVLKQNTDTTKASAMALGQSTPGMDAMTAGRGIGNAQAGADQRAVGQGNLLRAQTQQNAQSQLAGVLGGQGALDAQQAGASAGAAQGFYQANRTLEGGAAKARKDLIGSAGQAVVGGVGMSEGGEVPGTPKVFGDDQKNDTVPAMLSPDEIVIPISITSRPDAPEAAAAFVRAVQARGATPGQRNFDGGGEVPDAPFTDTQTEGADGRSAGREWLQTGTGPKVISSKVITGPIPQPGDPFASQTQDPSIANGGLLDSRNYNQTRDAALANSNGLLAQFTGNGPSTAPQAMQNAQDSTIAEAMQAQAGARRPLDVTGAATQQMQGAAGNAAGIAAGESQRGGAAFADAVMRQRAQDLSFATAQQQAAWHNSMMNAGIGLEQQAQLRQLVGAAGQGAAAIPSMFSQDKGGGGKFDANTQSYGYDGGTGRYDTTPNYEPPVGNPDEWNSYAEGGVVENHLARRQGTRRPGGRPASEESVSERRAAETGKRLRERVTPPVVDSSWQGVRERRGGTQTEDVLQFAEGGTVPGILSRFASYMSSPVQSPDLSAAMGDGENAYQTPEMLAERQRLFPAPPAGPMPAAPRAVPPATLHTAPAPIQPAAPPPAAPQAKPAAPRGAPTQAKPDNYAAAQGALKEKAAVEGAQADATAQALGGLQKSLEQNAIAQNETHARASQQAHQQFGALEQARQEMKRINTDVDPAAGWSKRGAPGKIGAAIGLVLGAIGNDGGVNRAAMLIQQITDRDLDALKAEHEFALRKGQSNVDSAANAYAMSRQITQDDIAATTAARGTLLDLAKNQVDLAAARAGSPLAKANLSALSAQLGMEKDKADAATRQRGFDNHIKQMAADTDRMQAEAQRAAAGAKAGPGFVAPGYTLSPGSKPKPEELEKWRAARAGADDVKAKATELRAMITSGNLDGMDRFKGPERAKAEALMGSLKVAAKEAFALGAISGSDMDLVMSQLADPTGMSGATTGDKAMTTKLDQFIRNADATVTKKGDTLGIVKEDQFAEARAWLAAHPNDPDAPAVRRKIEAR